MMRIKDFLEYVSLLPEDCIEVKILHFLLFFDTGKYGNTVRSLINFGMQGFPCCRGRIRRARCAAMKE